MKILFVFECKGTAFFLYSQIKMKKNAIFRYFSTISTYLQANAILFTKLVKIIEEAKFRDCYVLSSCDFRLPRCLHPDFIGDCRETSRG
ncbi:MAG: hypothetical protein ACI30J_09155 [Paludibacteraceae bacterium]